MKTGSFQMKVFILLLFTIFLCFSQSVYSQMSGVYSVGKNASDSFSTISSAINALISKALMVIFQ